ncbi:hypothetical protein AQUCO_02400033v1, partial [Aquilegia coerulea]
QITKVTNEKNWGNASGKIDMLWNLYISVDQHELNELKKTYGGWNIKAEASWWEDGSEFKRRKMLYGVPPPMHLLSHLLDAKKSYQMEASSVEDILPKDIIKVIIFMQSHTRFLYAILQFMNENDMHESFHLLRKESGVGLINPQAF